MQKLSVKKTAIALAVAHTLSANAFATTNYVVDSDKDLPIERNDQACTLREAVERALVGTANDCDPVTTGGPPVITFSFTEPTTITLADYGGTSNASIKIDRDLTIQGPAGTSPIVTLNGADDDPVFELSNFDSDANATSDVVLDNLIITKGASSSYAGGIVVGTNTIVTLRNSTVTDNRGRDGGGIFVASTGKAILENSSVSLNRASNSGGGIFVRSGGEVSLTSSEVNENSSGSSAGGVRSEGTVYISDSQVSSNTSDSSGGGIFSNAGRVTIVNGSEISNNIVRFGASGGGIYASGDTLYIYDSKVENNDLEYLTSQSGGGILIDRVPNVKIENTQVSNNTAGNRGGGIYINVANESTASFTNVTITRNSQAINLPGNSGGGGIYARASGTGILEVMNSAISNNTALVGGGVYSSGYLKVVNTTVDGNTATGGPGGGIRNRFGLLQVDKSTVSNNSASSGGGLSLIYSAEIVNSTISSNRNNANSGGIENASGYSKLINSTVAYNTNNGVQNLGNALLLVSNSILAGNDGNDCEGGNPDNVFRRGSNLVETNLGCTPSNTTFAIEGVPALLGELDDNGGGTLTHGLCPNSPAINAGDQTECSNQNITQDQRASNRDAICDIGAFELLRPLSCDDSSFFVIPLKDKRSVIFEL